MLYIQQQWGARMWNQVHVSDFKQPILYLNRQLFSTAVHVHKYNAVV